jgi:hypothetical protein
MIHGRIEINVNLGAVVLDDLIGIHVSPASLSKDPCVVHFITCVIGISDISFSLNNNVLIVDLDVPDFTVRWN